MNALLNQETILLAIGTLILLFFILFVWLLLLAGKLKKVRKQFRQLTNGTTRENLESILERHLNQLESAKNEHQELREQIGEMKHLLQSKKGNVGVVRFNAFDYEGSNLSFSIAVIDDLEDGFVITGIYGRENSRIYAKPVDKGTSNYHLTEEEIEAIEKARKTGLAQN
jgi:hypothetical protein